jgi:hypothetical protein
LKLGTAGAALPLTTAEASTEALNSGDSDQNLLQFADELSRAKKLKVEAPQPQQEKQKGTKEEG